MQARKQTYVSAAIPTVTNKFSNKTRKELISKLSGENKVKALELQDYHAPPNLLILLC
jgi:hypothetical protein